MSEAREGGVALPEGLAAMVIRREERLTLEVPAPGSPFDAWGLLEPLGYELAQMAWGEMPGDPSLLVVKRTLERGA